MGDTTSITPTSIESNAETMPREPEFFAVEMLCMPDISCQMPMITMPILAIPSALNVHSNPSISIIDAGTSVTALLCPFKLKLDMNNGMQSMISIKPIMVMMIFITCIGRTQNINPKSTIITPRTKREFPIALNIPDIAAVADENTGLACSTGLTFLFFSSISVCIR